MPVKRFMHPALPLYTRRRMTSGTGKEYWGFEKVNLGAGRKPAGPFWIRHTAEDGKQKWVSAGDDYNAAIEQRDKMLAVKLADRQGLTVDDADRKEAANIGTKTLADAVKDFLHYTEHDKERKPATIEAYSRNLDLFQECLGSRVRFVSEVTKDHVWKFAAYLKNQNPPKAKSTINKCIEYLRIFLKHAESTVKIKLPRVQEKEVTAYDEEQVTKLRKAAKGTERLLIDFMLGTGCRDAEAQHAEWSDFDFAQRLFTVQAKPQWNHTTKDYENRKNTVAVELLELVKEHRKKSASSLMFPNKHGKPDKHLLRIVKRVAFRAGLNCGECEKTQDGENPRSCLYSAVCSDFTLRRFRKTWATRLHNAGVTVRDLQKMLGHEELETTERYLAASNQKAPHIRAAADLAFA